MPRVSSLPASSAVTARRRAGALVAVATFAATLAVSGPGVAPSAAAPPPRAVECVARPDGETVCGYHCVTAFGLTRCARTPGGACASGSGIVACWDPPPIVKNVLGDRAPRPQCTIVQGRLACGYRCINSHDQAQCAETPWGACAAGDGVVACWDPPVAVIASLRERTPAASCITGFRDVACGYHCVAGERIVRCAVTPEGSCRAQRGTVTCFDEPLESRGVVTDAAQGAACLEGTEPRACGHHCVANRWHNRCAPSDREVCTDERDEIVCKVHEP